MRGAIHRRESSHPFACQRVTWKAKVVQKTFCSAPPRPFFQQDSGFRGNPDSRFLFESDPQESPNGHGHPSICPSDVSNSYPKSSNDGLSGEYFQHAPSSWIRVGETSRGNDARREHHMHGLHPCAHPCCQGQAQQKGGL